MHVRPPFPQPSQFYSFCGNLGATAQATRIPPPTPTQSQAPPARMMWSRADPPRTASHQGRRLLDSSTTGRLSSQQRHQGGTRTSVQKSSCTPTDTDTGRRPLARSGSPSHHPSALRLPTGRTCGAGRCWWRTTTTRTTPSLPAVRAAPSFPSPFLPPLPRLAASARPSQGRQPIRQPCLAGLTVSLGICVQGPWLVTSRWRACPSSTART